MIRVLAFVFPSVLLAGCFSQQPAPAVDRSVAAQSRASVPAQPSGPGYYTVKRGDRLYRIALEKDLDYRDIAAWNNLANPSEIKEGQVLRLTPPAAGEAGGVAVTKPIVSEGVVEARSLDQPSVGGQSAAPADGVKREPRVGKEPYSDEAYARLNKSGEAAAKPPEARVESKPETKPEANTTAATGPDDVPWMWPSSAKVVSQYSDPGNKGIDFSGKAGDPILAAGEGKVVYAGSGLPGYGELVIVKHNATFLSAYAHNRKILVKEGQQVTRGQKIAEMGNTGTDSVKLHFEIRKQGKAVDPAQFLPKR